MEIVILEYSDGKVIRVSLNAVQEKDFNKDSDTFIEMLSEIYSFRVKDINWMVTHDLDENHNLSDDIGENCEELRKNYSSASSGVSEASFLLGRMPKIFCFSSR